MTNLFDTASYPTIEPESAQAGDRWRWRLAGLEADYPPADYAVSYVARMDGAGSTTFTITAVETSGEYVVEVASATTGAYTAGTYRWTKYVTRSSDSQRIEIGRGTIIVTPNLAAATSDPRSHVKKVLDAIESLIEGRATTDVASYSIGGRSLSKMSVAELLQFRSQYKGYYDSELASERVARGLGTGRKILTRL